MTDPLITVVVASRNRAALLPRLIDALEAQVDHPPFAVTIVDDASTDGTADVLARLQRNTSLELTVLRADRNRGPAAARNRGWRKVTTPHILFTDDDCVPQPQWVGALGRALDTHDIVQGRTEGNPALPHKGMFSRSPTNTSETGIYETCNMGYRRSALAAVDGFDERFGPARGDASGEAYIAPVWGEDTDLAWRAKKAGASSTYVDDALVYHDWKPGTFRDELRDLRRRPSNVVVVKRHPEVRSAFEHPYAVAKAHPPALLSIVALVVAATRPTSGRRWFVALAALGLWAPFRARYYPPRSWPRMLWRWYVVDVADASLMAAASIRHRTFLL